MTAGAGKNYDNEGTGTFSWAIANDKLDLGASDGSNINFALKSKTDNKYTFTITEPSGTFEPDFFRAKSLNISDLNGKILSFDEVGGSCTARTVKFTTNSIVIKEVCPDGNFEHHPTVSVVSDVDNAIKFSWVAGENNDLLDKTMFLIDGDISQSSTVAFININNNVFESVSTSALTATTQEAF